MKQGSSFFTVKENAAGNTNNPWYLDMRKNRTSRRRRGRRQEPAVRRGMSKQKTCCERMWKVKTNATSVKIALEGRDKEDRMVRRYQPRKRGNERVKEERIVTQTKIEPLHREHTSLALHRREYCWSLIMCSSLATIASGHPCPSLRPDVSARH